jgi:ABC-2 type transport system permease protein
MNTQSNAESFDSQRTAPTVTQATRPFYWSVRRELWENRSIYIAPLAVAAVTLFGYLIASIGRALSLTDLAQRRRVLEEPYTFAMGVIMATAFIVGIFYSLDALHGERCMASAAIAASCSGSLCRFPISLRCCRRRPFRWSLCPCLPSR